MFSPADLLIVWIDLGELLGLLVERLLQELGDNARDEPFQNNLKKSVRQVRLELYDATRPRTPPTVAPNAPSIEPSMTKTRRVPLRLTPSARAVPISFVRSITLIPMVLTTVKSTMMPMIVEMNRKIVSRLPECQLVEKKPSVRSRKVAQP